MNANVQFDPNNFGYNSTMWFKISGNGLYEPRLVRVTEQQASAMVTLGYDVEVDPQMTDTLQ